MLIPSTYFLYSVYQNEVIKNEIDKLVLQPIKQQGNEILKWEINNKDSVTEIKVYNSGNPLSDNLKQNIDSSLHQHNMKNYFLVAIRLNLTKQEINQLSAETTKRMFDEMRLQEIQQQSLHQQDTLSYDQIFQETKVAFPFLDTIYNGWLTLPGTLKSIDTLAVIFYKPSKDINRSQTKQLYSYLITRFKKDSVVMINEKTIPVIK